MFPIGFHHRLRRHCSFGPFNFYSITLFWFGDADIFQARRYACSFLPRPSSSFLSFDFGI